MRYATLQNSLDKLKIPDKWVLFSNNNIKSKNAILKINDFRFLINWEKKELNIIHSTGELN